MKTRFASVAATFLVLVCTMISPARAEEGFKSCWKTDVNLDTYINVLDVQIIINHVLDPTLPNPEDSDVNCDGAVNVLDAQWAINQVLELLVSSGCPAACE